MLALCTEWKGAERLGEYCERLLRGRSREQAADRRAGWRQGGEARHRQTAGLVGRRPVSPHRAIAENRGHGTHRAFAGRDLAAPLRGWGLIATMAMRYAGDRRGQPLRPTRGIERAGGFIPPQTFSQAVRRLRSDAQLWQALSSAGKHTAESKHGVDVVAGQLLESCVQAARSPCTHLT